MAVGPVNRALLESNFQNPGDIYLDTKTEGAIDVLADQIDDNAVIFGPNGSASVVSAPIAGVTGDNVYDQLVFMESQIQANTTGVIAPGTVTNAMLQTDAVDNRVLADEAVSFSNLDQAIQTSSVGGQVYAYRNLGGF